LKEWSFELHVSRILRFALAIQIVILLGSAVAISRDYQDSWVLEGLELPFAVFIVTYIAYFMVEKRFNSLILIALIAHATFLLIPNLKYVWFQGVAIDQHRQYRLALDTYNEGYINEGNIYSETPLLALSFAVYSAISGLPVLQSMKYFPIILWFTYPIWIYIILRRLGANFSLLKYALLVSSIPVKPEISYVVVGSLFGVFFVLLVLVQFMKLGENRKRNDWIVAIIFTLALVAGHSLSSIMLSTILLIVSILLLILGRFSHYFTSAKPSLHGTLTIIVISVAWFSLIAQQILELSIDFFLYNLNRLFNITLGHPRVITQSELIPMTFLKLDFLSRLKVLLVFNGGDYLLMMFTLVAVLIIIKKSWLRKQRGLLLLSFYAITLMIFLLLGLVLNLGFNWDDRVFRLVSIVTPIFSGIFLYYIETKLRSKVVPMLIIGLLIVLATIQSYKYQPLIPAASSIGNQFPSDEPLVYRGLVNTAYQRYMIDHAERHLPSGTRIAADEVTGSQIVGLTSWNFSQDHKFSYPLRKETTAPYDYFLLHLPGISGKFEERAENRTRNVILSIIYDLDHNIVYSNGESYILDKR